jgi:hypothetical protein
LNIGAGGGYVLALRYSNQFDSTEQFSCLSRGSVTPTLNIGFEINPRVSFFFQYTHFLIITERPDKRILQHSIFALAANVVPSDKFSNIYLSFSLGYLQYWMPLFKNESGFGGLGLATSAACGYRLNNHFRVQIDMDFLAYGMSASINKTTIDANDPSNTIKNLGSDSFGDNWFDISLGLSAFWDIF